MPSARNRIIMGLTEADATMTQDWIDPVGRLSIARPLSLNSGDRIGRW
jgi:hypothetical protein